MVIVIMGVAGCGKTTVGRLLADRLGLPFHDADDFHSFQSIEKMRTGIPLNDQDRAPWLDALASGIAEWNRGNGAVLACSALKESHRCILNGMGKEEVLFVCLIADKTLIQKRIAGRMGHFFSPALLQSQLDVLEIPSDAIIVYSDQPPDEISFNLAERLKIFFQVHRPRR